MKRNFLMATFIVALGVLLAFTLKPINNEKEELLQGCVPPCPMVDVQSNIDWSCACNPPVISPPKLQVYGCAGTAHDWIDFCTFSPGLTPLPCLSGDCGIGCATGFIIMGYDMPFPASGGVATYTAPGVTCYCPEKTIQVVIDCSGPTCSVSIDCI